jgi:biopolymer transport protein ExbD
MRSRASYHSKLAELNITPLLDLVFVLLVIFIIATPQLMNNLEITLPAGKPPPAKPSTPRLERIFVTAAGENRLNGQPVSTAALTNTLRLLKDSNPSLAVVVQSDGEADYQRMINILDILRELDVTKVGIATASP